MCVCVCVLWLWVLLGCLYNSTQEASTLLTALDLYPTHPLSQPLSLRLSMPVQSLSAFWGKQVYRILITFASHATGEAEREREACHTHIF